MGKKEKLKILVIGEHLHRFTSQVVALEDKCSFYFLEETSALLKDNSDETFSLIIFHYKKVNEERVSFIRRMKCFFNRQSLIVLCEKISKKDMCTLFRLRVRDVLEQSFKKEIILEEVIDRINMILLSNENSNGHKKISPEIYLRHLLKSGKDYPVDKRIYNAKEYIRNNYDSVLSLDTVSQVACMSKYHFCRTFKKVERVSFSHYVNSLRISKAKKLLVETSASISEIAFEVGFLSLSHFTNIFKVSENIPPRKYRKEFVADDFDSF